MSRYSFSQVQTFQTCPLKYRYQYVDKLWADLKEDNLSFALGSSVHNCLEWLYKRVMAKILPTQAETIQNFEFQWEKEIGQFDQIPHEEELIASHERGKDYINTYYEKHYPFDQARFLQTEMNVSTKLSDYITFSGKIDRLDFNDDVLTINDYKTNKIRPENEDDTHKEQLLLYALAIKQKYEGKYKKLFGRLIYLHPGNDITWEIEDNQIEEIHTKYLELCQIIDDAKLQFSFGNEDAFKPMKWSHCKFCKFQQICPLWKWMFLEDEEISVSSLGINTVREAVDSFAHIRNTIKDMELQLEWLKSLLVEYSIDKWVRSLRGHKYLISMRELITVGVKPEKINELETYLQEKWLYNQTHKIDTHALKKMVWEKVINETDLKDWISEKKTVFPASVSLLKGGSEDGDE